ncbi:MAG: U32 family peptidase [Gammaproteobacteria bacterium]|jgi:putative protease|nr:U32 family peptidase [Gammaproteobacteria bacterium]
MITAEEGTRSAGPELLSPAGTVRSLRYALAYGADAVYAGIPRYSLRVRNNEFGNLAALAEGIAAVHAAGKRFYLAANLMPHGAKLETFVADLEPVVALNPDALIMSDPGLIMLVRERWPELPVHLSVQANTTNAAAVRFWQQQGIRRIILSRELSLDEIAAIRSACPDIELEVFVHGGLAPGADQKSRPKPKPKQERHPEADQIWWLEESERPGEYMALFEDEHGSYVMNSRDLCAVEHVARLSAIGIDSLKIEGRTKSHYYSARTTSVYRRAIDDAVAGRPFDPALLEELQGLANRGYTEGFLRRHAPAALQNYDNRSSFSAQRQFVGEVVRVDPEGGTAEIRVRNRFAPGDEIEWITPSGTERVRLTRVMTTDGQYLDRAPGDGWTVRLDLPGRPVSEVALLARVL